MQSKGDSFLGLLFFPALLGFLGFTASNVYFNGLSWLYQTPAGPILCLLLAGIILLGLSLSTLHKHTLRIDDNLWRLSNGEPLNISENDSNERLSKLK